MYWMNEFPVIVLFDLDTLCVQQKIWPDGGTRGRSRGQSHHMDIKTLKVIWNVSFGKQSQALCGKWFLCELKQPFSVPLHYVFKDTCFYDSSSNYLENIHFDLHAAVITNQPSGNREVHPEASELHIKARQQVYNFPRVFLQHFHQCWTHCHQFTQWISLAFKELIM